MTAFLFQNEEECRMSDTVEQAKPQAMLWLLSYSNHNAQVYLKAYADTVVLDENENKQLLLSLYQPQGKTERAESILSSLGDEGTNSDTVKHNAELLRKVKSNTRKYSSPCHAC
jgi:hypothetical protein